MFFVVYDTAFKKFMETKCLDHITENTNLIFKQNAETVFKYKFQYTDAYDTLTR